MAKKKKFVDDTPNNQQVEQMKKSSEEAIKLSEATAKQIVDTFSEVAKNLKTLTDDIAKHTVETSKDVAQETVDVEADTQSRIEALRAAREHKEVVSRIESIDNTYKYTVEQASKTATATQHIVKRNSEQENAVYHRVLETRFKDEYKEFKINQETILKLEEGIQQLRNKKFTKGLTEEESKRLKSQEKTLTELYGKAAAFESVSNQAKEQAVRISAAKEQKIYAGLTIQKRIAYDKELKEELELQKEKASEELAILEDSIAEQDKIIESNDKTEKEKKDAENKKKELEKAREAATSAKDVATAESKNVQDRLSKNLRTQSKIRQKTSQSSEAVLETVKQSREDLKAAKVRKKIADQNIQDLNKQYKRNKEVKDLNAELEKAKKKGDTDEIKRLEKELEKKRENFEKSSEYQDALAEQEAAYAEQEKARKEKEEADNVSARERAKETAKAVSNTVLNIAGDISGNLEAMYGQQGRMMGRLQGSTADWVKSVDKVSSVIGLNGLVSQKNVVSKMIELVDSGVAYNLEMRAFLAETSQNIASTFDAANGTLLRLIRLQQQDSTSARLGMEAFLTNFLNERFNDTAYLTNSGPADAIAAAILDTTAPMSRDEALKFEFNVQKWLGSLYSLGMSDAGVQMIAEGINYLGTGNVSALSGNSALQTLFALSASQMSSSTYAEMLTDGLNASKVNDLLKSMVEYLAQIASSQSNQVTAAAYAELLGVSLTDLRTFSSLQNSNKVSGIYDSSINYAGMQTEVQKQLESIVERVSLSKLVDTVIENAEVGAATTIGSTAVGLAAWKSTEILKKYIGKVEIPGFTGFGTGISSSLDLLNIAQAAIAGIGLLGSLVKGVGSMMSGGPTILDNWDFEEYNTGGSGLGASLATGSSSSTSMSGKIGTGNTSGEDVESTSMESAKEQGMDAAGTTSEEIEEEKEIPKKIYEAIAEGDTSLRGILAKINTELSNTNNILKTSRIATDPDIDYSALTAAVSNSYTQSTSGYNTDMKSLLSRDRIFNIAIAGVLSNKKGAAEYISSDLRSISYANSSMQSLSEFISSKNISSTSSSSSGGSNGSSSSSSSTNTSKLEELLSEKRVFYTAITGVMTQNAVNELTNLSNQVSTLKNKSTVTVSTTTPSSSSGSAYTPDGQNKFASAATRTIANGTMDLQSLIANAVAEGLTAYINANTTLPVSTK